MSTTIKEKREHKNLCLKLLGKQRKRNSKLGEISIMIHSIELLQRLYINIHLVKETGEMDQLTNLTDFPPKPD